MLSDLQRALRSELNTLTTERDSLNDKIALLEKTESQLFGKKLIQKAPPKVAAKATTKASGKRVRRSAEELKQYAADIHAFVKAHPGSSGVDIRKQFPKVGIDIKGFVANQGLKLKTVGERSAMRYSAA